VTNREGALDVTIVQRTFHQVPQLLSVEDSAFPAILIAGVVRELDGIDHVDLEAEQL